MNKFLASIFVLFMVNSEFAWPDDEVSKARLIREFAERNASLDAWQYVTLCDSEQNQTWCLGYFSAVYASIEAKGGSVCAPKHKKSEKVVFDASWSMIKASLYKYPEGEKVNFYNMVLSALSSEKGCGK